MSKMQFVDKRALRYFNAKLKAKYKTKASIDHTHTGLLDESLSSFVSSIKDADTVGIVSGVLLKGEKTIILDTGVNITDDNDILVYTSVYGTTPDAVESVGTQVTLTFSKQTKDIAIVVVIK